MRPRPRFAFLAAQSGAFVLEALVGILLFAFGVLGIVALQAQSMQADNESQYRAEATQLASSLLSEMWADDPAALPATYDSASGGTGYAAFKARVLAKLSAAWVADPLVEFDDANAPSRQSRSVTITIAYRMPGEATAHRYVARGAIGHNR